MKKQLVMPVKIFTIIIFLFSATIVDAQNDKDGSRFLDKVRFGGGIGLNAGNGFFSFNISPSAIYEVNEYFAFGPSVIYSYQSSDNFKSQLYGGSVLGLANPIPQVQLSAELEQVRVNQVLGSGAAKVNDDFWNTALFFGAGYRAQNVTIGIRYNVLYKEGESVYADAWSPFVRVFF